MSPLEETVMNVIWARGPCTGDDVRKALWRKQAMKESTVRTVLHRLEQKGYLVHDVAGRTYVYRERVPARKAAAQAVRQIVKRFCEGSVEQLLVGMVDDRMLTALELEELARKIAQSGALEGEDVP
jgi:BlaI family penicillinase repressor